MKSLKELREHNNLKQREVAQHIGVSDRVYAYYENGRTLPAKYVKPLANLFGISCDEFLENTDNPLVWEKEFGCIERTERLELPTWEELDKKKEHYISFTTKGWTKCWLAIDMPYKNDFGKILITYADTDNKYYIIYDKRLTKENYTLACRKAKELFLRGENDTN